mmetsp:Transcript_21170/g.36081  ORF Transcript_21170/g.36081 Transcript_21170/m.36081 type:complete len:977 (+) Transcript_21170:36-2966(+)
MSTNWSPSDAAAKKRKQEKVSDSATNAISAEHKQTKLAELLNKASVYAQFLGGQLTHNTYAIGGKNDDSKIEKAKVVDGIEQNIVQQPNLVTGGRLRDYQMVAVNWLISLFENGVNGILADEMGLGKTVITIAFFAHMWEKCMKGPFLVVAPLSTLQNWVNEFKKFAPELPVILYHGTPQEREELRADFLRQKFGAEAEATKKTGRRSKKGGFSKVDDNVALPVVVTSFDIAMRDRPFLQQHQWRFLVVDEAHRLKNFNCRLIRELRVVPSLNRLLLTGTPLQNNLTELWSLLNFILPEIFDNLENFQSWFDFEDELAANDDYEPANKKAKAKENDTSTSTTKDSNTNGTAKKEKTEEKDATAAVAEAVAAAAATPLTSKSELVEKLHNVLRPFFLRRLKVDVAFDLPKKREIVLYAGMTPVQRAYYEAIKNRDMDALTATVDANVVQKKPKLANLFMQLRKVCNHPCLMNANFDNFYGNWRHPNKKKLLSARQREEQAEQERQAAGGKRARLRETERKDYRNDMTETEFNALLEEADRREARRERRKMRQKGIDVPFEEGDDEDSEAEDTAQQAEIKRAKSAFMCYAAARRSAVKAELEALAEARRNGEAPAEEETKEEEKSAPVDAISKRAAAEAKMTIAKNKDSDDEDDDDDNAEESDDSAIEAEEADDFKVTLGDVMRHIGHEWREMDEKARKPYVEESEADRRRFEMEMAEQMRELGGEDGGDTMFIDDPKVYLQMLRDSCGKFELLDKMLSQLLKDGHKCLIFSQMTRMLDILQDYLELKGHRVARIDGSTKQIERQQSIDTFNKDPNMSIFLLSTRAGGLGINLTSADTVIIYDSDWNPQGDLQAQDRAHRIGQKRSVVVYRMITGRSCESRLLQRATDKLKLESLVISKGDFKKRSQVKITDGDLAEILTLEMGDAKLGKEAPITDDELRNVLDRDWVVNNFDKEMANKEGGKGAAGFEVMREFQAKF